MECKMKKTAIVSIILLAITGCSEEQQNKFSRLGVTWLEGNYKVTFAEGTNQKSWLVKEGKVTAEPVKGYYYFWTENNGKRLYVQTPIARTYIEQIGE
jgi:uncharacterized protein YcfL